MQTFFGHIQLNVHPENMAFYKDLMSFLGWKALVDHENFLGVGDKNQASLWFIGGAKDVQNDYDGPGVNHIGIQAASVEDVDAAAAYLLERGVEHLFGTPQHRAEFSQPGSTYYQVMFESPDRILFEIVYIGPHS